MLNSSIWSIDKTLLGATTPSQSGSGVIAMKEYSTFPKAPGHLLGDSYLSAEMQSVHSTAPTDKAKNKACKNYEPLNPPWEISSQIKIDIQISLVK